MLCIGVGLGFRVLSLRRPKAVRASTQNPKLKALNLKLHFATWYSCKDFTVRPLVWIERMALILASTPLMVVRIGIRRATAKLRIFTSSFLGVLPLGVLIIRL